MGLKQQPQSVREDNKIAEQTSAREEASEARARKQGLGVILRRFLGAAHLVITYLLDLLIKSYKYIIMHPPQEQFV
jgi:hypothetical protein